MGRPFYAVGKNVNVGVACGMCHHAKTIERGARWHRMGCTHPDAVHHYNRIAPVIVVRQDKGL